jgi:hypothetical protein
MAHLYYEIPLPRLFEMTTEEFLQLCSDFLAAAVKEDSDRETDEAARQYALKRFGFDPGDPEFGSLGAW